jgi:hypothetical protein
MAEQRVWRINLGRVMGMNTQEPGVVEVAAPTKEGAIKVLAEQLMALLTARGVMLDTTREYIGAAAMGDSWQPDYGQYEATDEEVTWHRLVYGAARQVVAKRQETEKATAPTVAS